MKDDAKRGIAAFCRDAKPGLILIENDHTAPILDFAFEIAARMVDREPRKSIVIWSRKASLSLRGMWLAGDSMSKFHCWTLQGEAQDASRDETWMELEDIHRKRWRIQQEANYGVHRRNREPLQNAVEDVVVLDLKLDFAEMSKLNKAAKKLGKKVVAYIDQFAVVIGNRPVRSYVELAMNIGVAHGVDFSDCAENVWRISRRPDTGSTHLSDFIFGKEIHSYDCKLLSSEGDNKFEDGFESESDNGISFHSEEVLMDSITFTN